MPRSSTHQNYETCLAIQCFAAANRDKRYDKLLKNAEAFVKGIQWDDSEGHDKSSVNYGGAGYGNSKRPDLSNTAFLIDALKSVGRGPDDEAMQKALVFVSRCQNLETEHNTTAFAAKNPDGGFYYTPAAGGASMAGKTAQRRPAQLRLDDLRRAEEHDLRRRRARRSARQSRHQVAGTTTTTWTKTPAWATAGLVLLLPHVRQGPERDGPGHVRRRRRARSTIGAAT